MKYIYLFLLLLFSGSNAPLWAQCSPDEALINITIVPDQFDYEISWTLHDNLTGDLLLQGESAGDSICIPAGNCVVFTLIDTYGDGILPPGYCAVTYNGTEIFNSQGTEYYEIVFPFNCPPGTICTSPFQVEQGVHLASKPDTWYTFIADSTGNYTVSTCGLENTCDTKLYAYDACPPVADDGPIGAIAYNDDFCNTQSQIILGLSAGQAVYLRIGDNTLNACPDSAIGWSVLYSGPMTGCMDTAACNFNPLAQVADNSLCQYPTPGAPCQGPDLVPGETTFLNSLYIDNQHFALPCEVSEGCILGTGQRSLLKYGVTIWNYGTQAYYPGTQSDNPNAYEYAECHGHFHYIGFAESYLYNANFEQIDFAQKTSYAVINTDCLPGVIPNGPALAPGCGDTYPAGYECQWVDVTDVQPGTYYLVLRVNGPQLPDFLGNAETDYSNNAISVCINIQDLPNNGGKSFNVVTDCPPFVDCAGTPLGNATLDCAGECNGVHLRADINADNAITANDLTQYMEEVVTGNIQHNTCLQLTNDTTYTVLDVARLNACIRSNDGEHNHIGNSSNHSHCNFPFHIINQQESVEIGLENMTTNYVDIRVKNAQTYLQGFELNITGVYVDSVQNLVANFNPTIMADTAGHLLVLALDEFPLNKYFDAPLLRVFFRAPAAPTVCIESIIDALNTNTERISATVGDCVMAVSSSPVIVAQVGLTMIPNPTTGLVQGRLGGGLLGHAHITVTDMMGRVVLRTVKSEFRPDFEIDLSGLPEGVYILSVENERFVASERVVVRR